MRNTFIRLLVIILGLLLCCPAKEAETHAYAPSLRQKPQPGVRLGLLASIKAATPLTTAAACEVPAMEK